MNVRLLRRIEKKILAEPKKYNQNDTTFYCGTAACIGGWAQHLTGNCDWRAALQLDDAELDRIIAPINDRTEFWSGGWPKRYSEAYEAAKTPAGRARVAVRRIEHFIKTKGKE